MSGYFLCCKACVVHALNILFLQNGSSKNLANKSIFDFIMESLLEYQLISTKQEHIEELIREWWEDISPVLEHHIKTYGARPYNPSSVSNDFFQGLVFEGIHNILFQCSLLNEFDDSLALSQALKSRESYSQIMDEIKAISHFEYGYFKNSDSNLLYRVMDIS